MANIETHTVWSSAVANSHSMANVNMSAPEWFYWFNQQFPLAFVAFYLVAIAIQGHFQHQHASKALKVAAAVIFTALLMGLAASAGVASHSRSHQSFEWSFSMYTALSLIFDCLVIGRLNDLCVPSIRLEDYPSPDASIFRRARSGLARMVKSCPPAFCFHLLQGTAVVGLSFQGLHHMGEYLKPQLIGNHFQAMKRLAWFESALVHFEAAAILEAVILLAFTCTVYIILVRKSSTNGDIGDCPQRRSWCALLIAAMLMSMRATSNAVMAFCNSTTSGQPLVDGSGLLFWLFDLLPVLCSFCLIFGMVDDDDNVSESKVRGTQPDYQDEKIVVISVPDSV